MFYQRIYMLNDSSHVKYVPLIYGHVINEESKSKLSHMV